MVLIGATSELDNCGILASPEVSPEENEAGSRPEGSRTPAVVDSAA
jgi:hypothetical protein